MTADTECPKRPNIKCETPLACAGGCRYRDDPIHPNREVAADTEAMEAALLQQREAVMGDSIEEILTAAQKEGNVSGRDVARALVEVCAKVADRYKDTEDHDVSLTAKWISDDIRALAARKETPNE